MPASPRCSKDPQAPSPNLPGATICSCQSAVALMQVAKHVMKGGRLPAPTPDQLPGPGGNFQVPDQAGGLVLYLALMGRCWAQRPEDRPTFTDIITSLRCVSRLPVPGPACLSSCTASFSWHCALKKRLGCCHLVRPFGLAAVQAYAGAGRAEWRPASKQRARASLSRGRECGCTPA